MDTAIDYNQVSDFRDHEWLGIIGCANDSEAMLEAMNYFKVSREQIILVVQKKRNGRVIYWARKKE